MVNEEMRKKSNRCFDLITGDKTVMFSAPHAVKHIREGSIKFAEPETGEIVKGLGHNGFPGIVKNSNNTEDPNFDEKSLYKQYLWEYVTGNDIHILFDLHELNSSRPMSVCIGTGRGKNIGYRDDLVQAVKECFETAGFENVTIDDPFAGAMEVTVSSFISRHCNIPAFQIEINSGLFIDNRENIEKVVSVLNEVADRCEELL